jgi:hypothetical protein
MAAIFISDKTDLKSITSDKEWGRDISNMSGRHKNYEFVYAS